MYAANTTNCNDELLPIDNSINSLKNQFYNTNNNFIESINNFFTELNNLKNNYIEKNFEVDKIINEISREKEELKKKNDELEEFKKVSFISSMHKRLEEKEQQLSTLQQKYNILGKQHNNLIISFKNNQETKTLKINQSKLSSKTDSDIITETELQLSDKYDSDKITETELQLSDKYDFDIVNSPKSSSHYNLSNESNQIIQSDSNKIELQSINNEEQSIDFEAEIDGKIYLFSKDDSGNGVYFKKLKNGTISKKISGNWKEDSDGELIID